MDSFENGAGDLEVSGTDWSAADAYAALQQDIAAHVSGLEIQKVRIRGSPQLVRICIRQATSF